MYIALKETAEYDALYLEELTVSELAKRIANCIGLQVLFHPLQLQLKCNLSLWSIL